MMELLGATATVLAVIGVVLNNRRMISCFYIWLVSNAISAVIHGSCGIYSLAARDMIFMVLAVEGWIRWSRPTKNPIKDPDE